MSKTCHRYDCFTSGISLSWSKVVRCLVCNRPYLTFMQSSLAQAFQTKVFYGEIHRLLLTNLSRSYFPRSNSVKVKDVLVS
jgi:hypothetical protein